MTLWLAQNPASTYGGCSHLAPPGKPNRPSRCLCHRGPTLQHQNTPVPAPASAWTFLLPLPFAVPFPGLCSARSPVCSPAMSSMQLQSAASCWAAARELPLLLALVLDPVVAPFECCEVRSMGLGALPGCCGPAGLSESSQRSSERLHMLCSCAEVLALSRASVQSRQQWQPTQQNKSASTRRTFRFVLPCSSQHCTAEHEA